MTIDLSSLPARQVHARAEATLAPPPGLVSAYQTPLTEGATVVSLGSRLAPALAAVLETRGFRRIRTDVPHPALPPLDPEAEDYAETGTGTGPIGNPIALEQLVRRCQGDFTPAEDRWHRGDLVVDPFRPGLRYPARSDREFDVLTGRYLTGVKSALRRAQVLLVSLTATEFPENTANRTALPGWPAEPLGDGYAIRRLTSRETLQSLYQTIRSARRLNPELHVLLMISPESIEATHEGQHVLAADMMSKATLRLGIAQLPAAPYITYVPALELAMAMGVTPDAVTTDARFLSALAEAVIAPEICPLPAPEPEKSKGEASKKAVADGADTSGDATSEDQDPGSSSPAIVSAPTAAEAETQTPSDAAPKPKRGRGKNKPAESATSDAPAPSAAGETVQPENAAPAQADAPDDQDLRKARRGRRASLGARPNKPGKATSSSAEAAETGAAAASASGEDAQALRQRRRARREGLEPRKKERAATRAAETDDASTAAKPRKNKRAGAAEASVGGADAAGETVPKRGRRKAAAQAEAGDGSAMRKAGRRKARQDTPA